ncbi:outer surface protein [Spiroplasma litorale]|uniref:Outer surface protein n=1 Tax=Spiroplasma litorale TaxID=216942 RepID=A0A0K1W1G6_9MOLU|nr:MupG family TIM beta-alpha barrel fold protein [Spiroplasma litorale]AKX34165.1 outer surface protein [Spiroplasma litorale]
MRKRHLGISVYPEHFTEEETNNYLKKCYEAGFRKVFFSILQLGDNPDKKLLEYYEKSIMYAKKLGYYTVVDINELALKLYKITDDQLAFFKTKGIDCIRLDAPFVASKVAQTTYQGMDIQINASNNDHFVTNICDFMPNKDRLFGCHNFYPLFHSGLSEDLFIKSTKKFRELDIEVSCFVGSDFGKKGPQKYDVTKLVSCENYRDLKIKNQIKLALSTNLFESIYVGNQPLSDEEIKSIKEIKFDNVFEFDLILEKSVSNYELEIINFNNHFWRGDANEFFIRSTQPRVVFKDDIKPTNLNDVYNFGDVLIINSNNKHYQKEILIVLKDNYKNFGDTVNKIGKISKEDLLLLKNIKPWNRFRFNIIG